MSTKLHSNGKLLFTGEYVILDGATGLALPTKYGQSMAVSKKKDTAIDWESYTLDKTCWFSATFRLTASGEFKATKQNPYTKRLENILTQAYVLAPTAVEKKRGAKIECHLDFPQNWGLGTSSTLISNIADWLGIDAFQLLEKTFGGSGYDIACAQTQSPITFRLENKTPHIEEVVFAPHFKNQLFFVHLNQKQNSRESIAHYRKVDKKQRETVINHISALTAEFISCRELSTFQHLIDTHERLISEVTQLVPVKEKHFADFPNAIKSLGGWGGDFIMAVGTESEKNYFREKGFSTILDYSDLFF